MELYQNTEQSLKVKGVDKTRNKDHSRTVQDHLSIAISQYHLERRNRLLQTLTQAAEHPPFSLFERGMERDRSRSHKFSNHGPEIFVEWIAPTVFGTSFEGGPL